MPNSSQPGDSPTIHEAELASGPSGAVEWGLEITQEEAVKRRRNQQEVVVRGPDGKANRRLARLIETAVGGPFSEDMAHSRSAGPQALPHFNQDSRSPGGHTFYETGKKRARKQKP